MIAAALGALMILVQADPGGVSPEKNAAVQSAMDAYLACMVTAARGMDNDTEPADMVAVAVESSCGDALRRVMDAVETGDTPDQRTADETLTDDVRERAATMAVLAERRMRHPPASN